ncbi:MAG: amidohydrolase [Bacteroidetes bacterium]|nr:amidohydrolase [Bacteroidota bacterium]MCH8523663.1 amidohydrolase [Balneolales bacterium]
MPALFDALRVTSQAIEKDLIALRRHLHQNPELSWQETNTAAHIKKLLAAKGIKTSKTVARTGFFVDIEGSLKDEGLPGDAAATKEDASQLKRCVAYRADMDALAIHDAKTAPYKSQHDGVAHLCGHDVHSTIAYGVACLLYEHRNKFTGTVRVFWQPAEETTPSGAPEMIQDGVLDGVEAVYGMHVDPTIGIGKIALKYGPDTASFDAFEITVKAPTTTHSARPHTGKDTIWIAHTIVQQMYQLSTRITDSRSPVVIAVSMFHGGDVLNVIPENVTFGGTIRASAESERLRIRNYVATLASQMEELHGVKIEVNMMHGAPPVENNGQLVEFAREHLSQILSAEQILDRDQSMGAEDFGYYTQEIPALFTRVGSASSVETSYPLHARSFDIDETIITPTTAIQAFLLMQHLNSGSLKL